MQCSEVPHSNETCGPHTLERKAVNGHFEVPRLDSNKHEGQTRLSKSVVLGWEEEMASGSLLQGRLWMLSSEEGRCLKPYQNGHLTWSLPSVFCLTIYLSYLKRPISLLLKYFIMKYSDIQNIYNSIICGHLVTIVFRGLPGGDSDKDPPERCSWGGRWEGSCLGMQCLKN